MPVSVRPLETVRREALPTRLAVRIAWGKSRGSTGGSGYDTICLYTIGLL